jgi:hypothetical protein
VREMMDSGEADTEEKARAAAQVIHDGILAALTFSDDDTEIDFNDLKLKFPHKVAKDCGMPLDTRDGPEEGAVDLDKENICIDAFKGAISAVSASMCQGPMIHHQFSMGTFLSSPYAVNTCADCDAEVHLLSAVFLSTRYGSCARCQRPRCLPCVALMHSKHRPSGFDPLDKGRHCMRCKPAPKTTTASAAAPPAPERPHGKPPARGSAKKGRKGS